MPRNRSDFRLQARGNVARSNIVKDLSAQFAGAVPTAKAEALAALEGRGSAQRSGAHSVAGNGNGNTTPSTTVLGNPAAAHTGVSAAG